MAARAGLRIGTSLGTWLAAATLAGAMLDMPLHPRAPRAGTSAGPLDPAVHVPPSRQEAQPPPKTEEKLIEFAPWEEIPS